MKLYIFGLLLLAIRRSLADDNIDLTSVFSPSEKCMAELTKYSGCMEGVNIEEMDMDTAESVNKFCTSLADEKCAALVSDSSKAQSDCISKDNSNMADQFSGLIYLSLKVAYSTYCAKGDDGKTCAFSQYLIDNIAKFDNATDLDDAGKKALADDCKDKKCHERLVNLKEMSTLFDSVSDQNTDENANSSSSLDNADIIDKYFEYYSKNECNKIDGSSSSSSSSTSTSSSDASYIMRFTLTTISLIIFSAFMLI